ncbi:MAG: PQQ-binding-like beta-propeller repeat protein [Planctomycetota bacterium]
MNIKQQCGWLNGPVRIVFSLACLIAVTLDAEAQYAMAFRTSAPEAKSTTLEGASLQTITDQELFKLRRAKEFAEEGDSLSAITLWQSVLDLAGSKLMTRDEWKYASARHEYPKFVTVAYEIESILAGLPDDALELYRIKADGEARAILANPEGRSRVEVLSEVVRRFFASSIGDDAAFELACLRLDRFEFTDASRLLRKCLHEHPDCSIPRQEVLLRLAVADGRIGDSESANESLSKLVASDDARIPMIRKDVTEGSGTSPSIVGQSTGNWLLKYGTSDRSAMMPGVPDRAFPSDLSELWSYDFDIRESPAQVNPNQPYGLYGSPYGTMYLSTGMYVAGGATVAGGQAKRKPRNSYDRIDRRLLVDQWKERGWTPVGGLLFFNGKVYFKSENRVVCCSAESGEMIWMGIENDFELDPKTRQQNMLSMSMPAQLSTGMKKPEQVQLFGDQIYQAMSIGEGNLYTIEGPTELDSPTPQVQGQQNPYIYGMSLPSRARRNWLTAYDAKSGKLRWRKTAFEGNLEDTKADIGFTCAPVAGAGLMYVTVNDSGTLWLHALDPATGATSWKTFLCDEPAGTCDALAATGITYAEGDVYIATGAGIISAVDGTSGALRWVVRYQRSGDARQTSNPYGLQYQLSEPAGWREDVVVAKGRVVIVMGSDSDEIFALDRRTGEILWDSPRNSKGMAEYYLGMRGNRLYVGASGIVRCYDSEGGRVIWEKSIEESSGTGIVTPNAVYVPTRSSIVKLSLEEGTELGRSKFTSMTREPVGNLYSDGKRLFGVGAARVFAFTDLEERLTELDQAVANDNIAAILERAKFRSFQGKRSGAWEDVRNAYTLLAASETTVPFDRLVSDELKNKSLSPKALASDVILQRLNEMGLPTATPKETLTLLLRMRTDLASSDSNTKVLENLVLRCDSCLYRSLASIQSSGKTGLAKEILSLAPFCNRDHLNRKARQAIATTIRANDLDALEEALDSQNEDAQQIAVAGLAKLGARGTGILNSRLKQDVSNRIRLEIAIALLNSEQLTGLDILGSLIESDDAEVQRDAVSALVSVSGRERDDELDESAINAWKDWIKSNRESSKLTLPYVPSPQRRGRTLVCYTNGIVEEFDLEGKSKWKTNTQGPASACGLNNGHRLIALMQQKRITEYDTAGKKVWNLGVDGFPTRVYRLENGNTLVAMQQPNRVCEYRPDGSIAWKFAASSIVMDARRMENGNTLIAFQEDRVIQVSPSGERVWELTGLSRPVSAQPLPNGNILVALSGNNRFAEYTPSMAVVSAQGSVNGILDAMRLDDGTTLVAAQAGIQRFSAEGKTLASGVPKRNSNNNRSSSGFVMSGSYVHIQNDQQLANRVFRF